MSDELGRSAEEIDDGTELPFDASEQHGVESRRKRVIDMRRARDSALGALLEIRPGRALVWELLRRSHLFHTSHVAGSPDGTAFREGERNVGLALLADVMRVTPAAFAVMQTEAAEDGAQMNKRASKTG